MIDVTEESQPKKESKGSLNAIDRANGQIKSSAFKRKGNVKQISRSAFKDSKKDFRLKKKNYRDNYKTFKNKNGKKANLTRKRQKEPLTKDAIKQKEALDKAKKELKSSKKTMKENRRAYTKVKKADPTSLRSKGKQEVKYAMTNKLREDDSLGDGIGAYQTTKRSYQNTRTAFKLTKGTADLTLKTGRGVYGFGNRLYNFSRKRGFQRTPPDQTTRSQLMKKARAFRQRRKAALEVKKAQNFSSTLQSMLSGKQTMSKGIGILAKNPITWLVLLVIMVVIILAGTIATTPKPAILQTDRALSDSWTYVTKLDAEESDDTNTFYTDIDPIMFYMNERFEDYEINEHYVPLKTYKSYLKTLWHDLNGKKPNYELKTMTDLITTEKTLYYLKKEVYEEYLETVDTFGYTTLDSPLEFPFKTDQLTVTRRFGYEKNNGKEVLHKGIEVETEAGIDIHSPLTGVVFSLPSANSVVIQMPEESKLTITGIKNTRLRVGDMIKVGDFIGRSTTSYLSFSYQLLDEKKNEWYDVNPGFYFPKVVYTQQTLIGTDYENQSLSPEVIALIPKFKQAMKDIGMPEKYLAVLLAICMQESAGKVPDVMQCSESLNLPPNTLGTDASIKQGTKYLWENMKMVGLDRIEKDEKYLKTAVQAYNFGGNFVSFSQKNGFAYTPELAVEFSQMMSGGTGLYGDSKYIPHVWRYMNVTGSGGGTGQFFYPLPNKINDISGFDYRINPKTGVYELHLGLDFPVGLGTPIYASEDAEVMRNSDVGDTYGINVVLKHSKGKWWTRYAHMSRANVSVGQKVKRGQVIGYVGDTGLSTGYHLHFEVMTSMYGGHVDPRTFIK